MRDWVQGHPCDFILIIDRVVVSSLTGSDQSISGLETSLPIYSVYLCMYVYIDIHTVYTRCNYT